MARIRKDASTAHLQDFDDVDKALAQIGQLDRELALIEAAQQEQIDHAKANSKREAEPLQTKKAALELAIQVFCDNNRAEFRNTKTRMLTFGSVGYRLSTRLIIKRGADVVQALKDFGLTHCIRIKEEADKEAMKQLSIAQLTELGVGLKTEDAFGYEINRERLAEAA